MYEFLVNTIQPITPPKPPYLSNYRETRQCPFPMGVYVLIDSAESGAAINK